MRQVLFTSLVLGAVSLVACGQPKHIPPAGKAEGHVNTLESKLRQLSERTRPLELSHADIPQPYEPKRDLEQVLQELQQRKVQLLEKYTPDHPDVVDLDRQMKIVRRQIEMFP
jgi:uncharacterized protein involved in exopolysaccharide biosynthesis